jgi:hypothetical protein
VVAAPVVVADQPGVGLDLELSDRREAATVERRSPALLQDGAVEAFADRVVETVDAAADEAERCGAEPIATPYR